MSNVYSLDTLRTELDAQFAPLELEIGKSTVVLRNVMRLGKTERQIVMDAVGKLDAEETGNDPELVMDALRVVLRTVTADNKGESVVKAIGDDLALAMKILELWTAATQPGEAENSPA